MALNLVPSTALANAVALATPATARIFRCINLGAIRRHNSTAAIDVQSVMADMQHQDRPALLSAVTGTKPQPSSTVSRDATAGQAQDATTTSSTTTAAATTLIQKLKGSIYGENIYNRTRLHI